MDDQEADTDASCSRTAESEKSLDEVPKSVKVKDANAWNGEKDDLPDLTDFVNQRTEDELDKLFADRYTMDNALYAEVANGFPDPVVVYPWNKRPKRNFDYTHASGDGQRRPWRGKRRNDEREWRGGWRNPSYDPYVAQGSRKRRNPDMDRDRISYPGRRDD